MAFNQNYVPSQHYLREIFQKVATDTSGFISFDELQKALSNGPWKPLSDETIRLMMDVFDNNESGKINFEEFSALWKYVVDWQNCFRTFDRDSNGNIDRKELRVALTKFGYILTEELINLIMRKYDRTGRGTLYFDDFIQSCVTLQYLTTSFKEFDVEMDGWSDIDYNKFLEIAFNANI